MKTNTFSIWVMWILTMVASFVAYQFHYPALAVSWVVLGSAVLALGSFLPMTLYAGRGHLFAPTGIPTGSSAFADTLPENQQPVDPWLRQRDLMRMSDQQLPTRPRLTRDSLLYFALILEEVAEGGATLLDLLRSTPLSPLQVQDFMLLRQTIAPAVRSMDLTSRRVKQMLEMQAFTTWAGRDLTLRQAKAIFDDHLDIQVVNSGFGLSLGLPCSAGYRRVDASNVSKKNPATGKIDKDPSGKWIKGPGFFPPDLESVLLEHCPEYRINPPAPTSPFSTL